MVESDYPNTCVMTGIFLTPKTTCRVPKANDNDQYIPALEDTTNRVNLISRPGCIPDQCLQQLAHHAISGQTASTRAGVRIHPTG